MKTAGIEPNEPEHRKLLELLVTGKPLTSEELKNLVMKIDNHDVLAKVFILEGTPFVFADRHMKYLIFR
jgi:hypothetical protein